MEVDGAEDTRRAHARACQAEYVLRTDRAGEPSAPQSLPKLGQSHLPPWRAARARLSRYTNAHVENATNCCNHPLRTGIAACSNCAAPSAATRRCRVSSWAASDATSPSLRPRHRAGLRGGVQGARKCHMATSRKATPRQAQGRPVKSDSARAPWCSRPQHAHHSHARWRRSGVWVQGPGRTICAACWRLPQVLGLWAAMSILAHARGHEAAVSLRSTWLGPQTARKSLASASSVIPVQGAAHFVKRRRLGTSVRRGSHGQAETGQASLPRQGCWPTPPRR